MLFVLIDSKHHRGPYPHSQLSPIWAPQEPHRPLLTCPFVSSPRHPALTAPQSPPLGVGPAQSPFLQRTFRTVPTPGLWPVACHLRSSHAHVRSLTCFRHRSTPSPSELLRVEPTPHTGLLRSGCPKSFPHCPRRPHFPSLPRVRLLWSGQGPLPDPRAPDSWA